MYDVLHLWNYPPYYFLPRPPVTLNEAQRAACDALLDEARRAPGLDLTARLPGPAWQVAAYLTDVHPVLIHGSRNATLRRFEPRRSYDTNPFGNRSAIFAASDGIWPMFFALLDRERHRMSMNNSCFRVTTPDGQQSEPYYFFSITQSALEQGPWAEGGTLYILPRDMFEPHPPREEGGLRYVQSEWASEQPVEPIAWFHIRPEDFPFRAQVRGHDDATLRARAADDPEGWPWLDEP